MVISTIKNLGSCNSAGGDSTGVSITIMGPSRQNDINGFPPKSRLPISTGNLYRLWKAEKLFHKQTGTATSLRIVENKSRKDDSVEDFGPGEDGTVEDISKMDAYLLYAAANKINNVRLNKADIYFRKGSGNCKIISNSISCKMPVNPNTIMPGIIITGTTAAGYHYYFATRRVNTQYFNVCYHNVITTNYIINGLHAINLIYFSDNSITNNTCERQETRSIIPGNGLWYNTFSNNQCKAAGSVGIHMTFNTSQHSVRNNYVFSFINTGIIANTVSMCTTPAVTQISDNIALTTAGKHIVSDLLFHTTANPYPSSIILIPQS